MLFILFEGELLAFQAAKQQSITEAVLQVVVSEIMGKEQDAWAWVLGFGLSKKGQQIVGDLEACFEVQGICFSMILFPRRSMSIPCVDLCKSTSFAHLETLANRPCPELKIHRIKGCCRGKGLCPNNMRVVFRTSTDR